MERDTQHYYKQYRQIRPDGNKFCGVKLKELPELEQLFEGNIFVYSLEPTKPDGDKEEAEDKENEPEIAAQLIYRSLCHYTSTLYLNLHQQHFS